jgi:phage gpG-like protein
VISHETVVYEKSFSVEGRTFKNAGRVSTQVKALLQKMNLSKEVARRGAISMKQASQKFLRNSMKQVYFSGMWPEYKTRGKHSISTNPGNTSVSPAMVAMFKQTNEDNR